MGKNLSIFIISGKSPLGDPGGYPAYSHTLSKILSSLDHKVYTLAISEKSRIEKSDYAEIHFLTTKLTKIIPVLKYLALGALPYYSFIFAKHIKKTMEKNKLEKLIIWGMGPWALAGVFLKFMVGKRAKVTVITSYFTSTRHEMKGAFSAIKIKDYGFLPKIRYFIIYEIIARVFHIFEKITLDNSDDIVIHYSSSRKIIKKYFGVKDEKIYKFPWFTEIFKRQGGKVIIKKIKHPLVVSICRQDPRKGINFIIRAIEIVSKKIPSITCFIIGSGSFFELNKKLVKKLGLEKNIRVLGFVPDINPVLKEADIVVIVPLAQGSSALTVLEAMSYGKAIVGSNCDGIPEDISHNKTGLIVKKGDGYSLADAILKLADDEKLRDRLGKSAYASYKQKFKFETMRNEIKNVLTRYTTLK